MVSTVIATDTTAGISLAALGDSLTVLAKGSIVGAAATINGSTQVSQSVSIAGYVDVLSMTLAGSDLVTIVQTGTFVGRAAVGISLGLNGSTAAVTGGNTLTNAGLIQSANAAIRLYGADNLMVNTGQITARIYTIETAALGGGQIDNTGVLASLSGIAVRMTGANDIFGNTGTVSGKIGAVLMAADQQTLHNDGYLRAQIAPAVTMTGNLASLFNDGSVLSGQGAAIQFSAASAASSAAIVNDGSISGTQGVTSTQGALHLVNHGSITGTTGDAISVTGGSATNTHIYENTGQITAGGNAMLLGAEIDRVLNIGMISGDIRMGAGNDLYDGRGGQLLGRVFGEAGSDTYIVDNADLELVEGAGNAGDVDTVMTGVSYELAANFEVLTMLGGKDLKGWGNADNNVLNGNAGDNKIFGQQGADTIEGRAGDDTLAGGGYADRLVGGDGDDRILGNAGNDYILGDDGADTIIGGLGRDTMTGGDDADLFVFRTNAEVGNTQFLADVIADFTQFVDLIDLSGIDAKEGNGPSNEAFTFIGFGAFSGTSGQLRYQQIDDKTYLEYDVTGNGVPDGVIRINALINFDTADFVL